jgi:6-phosphogluconate dehydrogenase
MILEPREVSLDALRQPRRRHVRKDLPERGILEKLFAPEFRADLISRMPGWRSVVAGAVSVGLPIPGLAASLSWFDTLATSRGSANLIQAQRDYFGSHTYERVDRPDHFVHTDWGALGGD